MQAREARRLCRRPPPHTHTQHPRTHPRRSHTHLSSVRSTYTTLGYMYVVRLPSLHSVNMSVTSFHEKESTMDCSFTCGWRGEEGG